MRFVIILIKLLCMYVCMYQKMMYFAKSLWPVVVFESFILNYEFYITLSA